MQVVRGWRGGLRPIELVLGGEYSFEVRWAGSVSRRVVERLVSCLLSRGSVRLGGAVVGVSLVEAGVEKVFPVPSGGVEARFLTPGQVLFRGRGGRGFVLGCPGLGRLLRHGVELLVGSRARGVVRLLDLFGGVVVNGLDPVTVVLDEKKSSAWAVEGVVRYVLSGEAPEWLESVLGGAGLLAGYAGVGKSRLSGFGLVDVGLVSP